MKLTFKNGDKTITVDNEGQVMGQVKIDGDDPSIVSNINRVMNIMTMVKYGMTKGLEDGLLFIDENKMPHIFTASDKYMEERLPSLMGRYGYTLA